MQVMQYVYRNSTMDYHSLMTADADAEWRRIEELKMSIYADRLESTLRIWVVEVDDKFQGRGYFKDLLHYIRQAARFYGIQRIRMQIVINKRFEKYLIKEGFRKQRGDYLLVLKQ
jgi:GNAT superfamily N-acetyltransferase